MDLAWACSTFLPWIEAEMRSVVCSGSQQLPGHYGMMEYHLGWADASFDPISAPSGKRIRPLLCLLACGAVGGDPRMALPAAAGLELLHNFSLIHDDIEDNSPTRRNRTTVWTLFGMPQACNAGDGMFSLAHLAFHRLRGTGVPETTVLDALELFDETCVALTEGQYLDMAFESRLDVTVAEYFQMIAAKTGALLAASPQMGSVVVGAPGEQTKLYRAFGAALGRAFQLQDDLLGIWGDEAVTGKSAASDILSKKKSLPVLTALADSRVGARLRWRYSAPVTPGDVPDILELLGQAGAREITEQAVRQATAAGHNALGRVRGAGNAEYLAILGELLDSLVGRRA